MDFDNIVLNADQRQTASIVCQCRPYGVVKQGVYHFSLTLIRESGEILNLDPFKNIGRICYGFGFFVPTL